MFAKYNLFILFAQKWVNFAWWDRILFSFRWFLNDRLFAKWAKKLASIRVYHSFIPFTLHCETLRNFTTNVVRTMYNVRTQMQFLPRIFSENCGYKPHPNRSRMTWYHSISKSLPLLKSIQRDINFWYKPRPLLGPIQ